MMRSTLPEGQKRVLGFTQHHLDIGKLSFAAEKVVERLHQAGFEAYVVGGAVRDLLLGVEPKDFDVATNATPEEVRKVFRRSRIIGRRFQIVHVMVGPETIEVTTFRGGGRVQHNEHGRIMKDNAYGTLEEDAMRRDFTCNALYFDPIRREIIDFHYGVEAVRERRLEMIGQPAARYQEDPVRILRAVRLSGKLGFTVEENTAAPIAEYLPRLSEEPPARLFDEITKILFSGHAVKCLEQFAKLGIAAPLHPLLDALLRTVQKPSSHRLAMSALASTDSRLHEDKPVSVGFVLAAVLWQPIEQEWRHNRNNGMKAAAALNAAVATAKENMEKGWGVPQRFTATMREIWQLQPQFEYRRGARPFRLLAQPRFRAAYDFLVLRAKAGEIPQEWADWWTAFQHADDDTRNQMVTASPESHEASSRARKRRRRPRRNKNRTEQNNG